MNSSRVSKPGSGGKGKQTCLQKGLHSGQEIKNDLVLPACKCSYKEIANVSHSCEKLTFAVSVILLFPTYRALPAGFYGLPEHSPTISERGLSCRHTLHASVRSEGNRRAGVTVSRL